MTSKHVNRRQLLFAGAAAGVGAVAATVSLSATASAASPAFPWGGRLAQPEIDSVAQWGARPPSSEPSLLPYQPSMIIVHHTVSVNNDDFSRERSHAHARWVQDLHMDGNGWPDTGYNFLVSRGGWLAEGRTGSLRALTAGDGFILGAHTAGQNDQGIGIANEGSYHDGAVPPDAQWTALVDLCAYACVQYGIPPTELYGHLDFGATLCPGIFHDMLPQLRDEVAQAIGS